ncbi:MAG: hypothetical protein ACXWVQ_06250 [Methyloceanibacter sp.]
MPLKRERAELDQLCQLSGIGGQPAFARFGEQDDRLGKVHGGGFQ